LHVLYQNLMKWKCSYLIFVHLCLQFGRITERYKKVHRACFWEWTEECCCLFQPYQCQLISTVLPSTKWKDELGFIFPFLFGLFFKEFGNLVIIEFPILRLSTFEIEADTFHYLSNCVGYEKAKNNIQIEHFSSIYTEYLTVLIYYLS
jgi:hypothetical protein